MALKNIHSTTGLYKEDRNDHLKKYENAKLAVYGEKLDAHFEGISMAFGYGYDLFQNMATLQKDLSDFISIDLNLLIQSYSSFDDAADDSSGGDLLTISNFIALPVVENTI